MLLIDLGVLSEGSTTNTHTLTHTYAHTLTHRPYSNPYPNPYLNTYLNPYPNPHLNSYPNTYLNLLFVSRQFVSLLLVFNNSSPLLFVSTTIRLYYNSSPLQFVSTTIRLHYFSSPHDSSPYYSSPLLFASTKFVSNNSSPLLFGSISILLVLYIILFWCLGKPTGKSSVTKVSQRERGPKGPFYRIQGCFNFSRGCKSVFWATP